MKLQLGQQSGNVLCWKDNNSHIWNSNRIVRISKKKNNTSIWDFDSKSYFKLTQDLTPELFHDINMK
jgi:hypothetical protein